MRRRRIVDLDAPDRLSVARPTATTDPEASEGIVLIAVKGARHASVALHPEQLAMLADRLLVIVDELERRGLLAIDVGGHEDERPEAPHARQADLHADALTVGWDDDGDRIVIEAFGEPAEDGAGNAVSAPAELSADDLMDIYEDDLDGPDLLRVRLVPVMAQRFARRVVDEDRRSGDTLPGDAATEEEP